MARWSLRTIAPLAAAGCAALAATALGRRRALNSASAGDPADRHLDDELMGELATGEGMPEPSGG